MSFFFVGLGLGYAIGTLFAPMRGTDLRERASAKGSALADSARKLKETAEERLQSVRGQERADSNTQFQKP